MIICVNDTFSGEQLAFYEKFNIKTPKKDVIYNIRKLINHRKLGIGVLLEEIVNAEVPIKSDLGFIANMEPDWNLKTRFRRLDYSEITDEWIREIKQELKLKV